jgi:hypothetical protein
MSSIIRATTSSGLQIAPDNSGSLILQTNGTTAAVTLDTSQNATFAGKVTSAGALTLASNGTTTAVTIDTSQRAAFVAGTAALPAITTTGDTNTGIFFPAADTIAFAEGGAESMRIDSSGNVLVGTTTRSNDEKVTINQSANAVGLSIRSNGGPALGNYESSDTTRSTYWTFGRDNAVTGNYVFAYGGTLRGSISLSTGTYTASSDSRLKKHITNITYGLNEVMAMRPVTYLMNEEADTAKKHLGFIAQEIKAVLDEAVDDLIDPETQFYMLDKGGLVPVLVKAIQEQQTIINDLKARVEALEAKLG